MELKSAESSALRSSAIHLASPFVLVDRTAKLKKVNPIRRSKRSLLEKEAKVDIKVEKVDTKVEKVDTKVGRVKAESAEVEKRAKEKVARESVIAGSVTRDRNQVVLVRALAAPPLPAAHHLPVALLPARLAALAVLPKLQAAPHPPLARLTRSQAARRRN